MSKGTMASRKFLLLSVWLVLLTWPQASSGFGFSFGGDEGDDDGVAGGGGGGGVSGDVSAKRVAKRRPLEKKFKFRKIERIYIDDDDYDGDADDDNDGDDDDDDDGGSDNDKVRSIEDVEASEAEDLHFERARTAHKDRHQVAFPKNAKQRAAANHEDSADATDDDDESKSFFGSLFGGGGGGIFGGAKEKNTESSENDRSNEESGTQSSNGIIDWLKWLIDREDDTPPPTPSPPTSMKDNLLTYFNRWPFNSLFPIGQPEKPIKMPRPSNAHRSSYMGRGSAGDDDDSGDAEAAMSQEHFESLLHTLPGFVVNPHQVRDAECRQQLQIFHRQLRGHKLWTLQMLDATGKIPSGLLRGNINQFGDFDLCTQVKMLVKVTPTTPMRIRGKYCLAHIELQTGVRDLKLPLRLLQGRGLMNSHLGNPSHFVPRYSVANWGICVPHMCSGKVVQEMIETNLRPYNTTGVDFHVEVDDDDCYVRQSRKIMKVMKKDSKFAMTLLYLAFVILLMIVTLLVEYWSVLKEFTKNKLKRGSSEAENTEEAFEASTLSALENEKTEDPEETVEKEKVVTEESEIPQTAEPLPIKTLFSEIFKSFSPKRTLHLLLSTDRLDMEFPIFHILKLGATFMLYVCLKFIMLGHLPITNRDKLVRALDQPSSVLFRTPFIYMDVLLLISGFLTAYQLSEEMEHKTYIQLLKRMALKIARYLPTVYMVLFFQTFMLPHLGSGPLWTNLIGQNGRLCEQQMWRNVFSVQNAIEFEETCSPMTIQLALEVQLFLLGPLVVWLYYTDRDAAFFVYGGLHAMSVAARFSRTQSEHLSMTLFHGMNVSKFYRTANIMFSSPISRATPYLLGIGAGMLYRSEGGILEVSNEFSAIGWGLTALSLFWCFWSAAPGMSTNFIYSSSEAAAYSAWCPLILGLALCWIIFMFPKNENSVLRFFTSTRPILFLSRIAFPLQLATYVVVLYNTASVKESRKYHITDLVNFNEIGVILLFATLLAFLVDVPSKNIRHLLVERIFIERPHSEQEQEPISGAEQSEAENSEDRSEQATCDTPEPPDSIWASDPEEEEKKYLNRRRSSATATEEKMDEKKIENKEEEEEQSEETEETEEAEETEETEETEEIGEEEEIKKRPPTPQPKSVTPPPPPPEQEAQLAYRRRRQLFNASTDSTETSSSSQSEAEPSYRRRRRPMSDDG